MTSQGTDTRAELADKIIEHVRWLGNTPMEISLHEWSYISNDMLAAAAALRAPAEREVVDAGAVPVGWFNPWNDTHGYQQVAEEFEGKPGTIPLYASPSPTREITDEMVERRAIIEECAKVADLRHAITRAKAKECKSPSQQSWFARSIEACCIADAIRRIAALSQEVGK